MVTRQTHDMDCQQDQHEAWSPESYITTLNTNIDNTCINHGNQTDNIIRCAVNKHANTQKHTHIHKY